jgi:hypothetical protein
MKTPLMLHALAASLLLLTGCGPAQLDRDAALKSINASSKFSPDTDEFSLSRAQTQCGVQAGLWKVAGSTNRIETFFWGFHYRYALTAKGRTLFGDIGLSYSDPEVATVELGIPHRRTALQVTGIADYKPSLSDYHGKEATFDWKWDPNEFPDQLKQCVPRMFSIQRGIAHFRLYDDGWRVEEIIRHPYPYSRE